MNKNIKIIIIIIIYSLITNVEALSKSDLTLLYLDSIKTIDKPDNYTSVQGGTTTDKYIITLFINENEDDNKNTAIQVLDKDTYKRIELENNPITEYDFHHANDATYNSNTNELVILSGRTLNFLDLNEDKFVLTRTQDLSKYYHGVGYDNENNQYILSRSIDGGSIIEKRDIDFNIINKFKIKTNLTKQSLTVYNGYIYYVCYESGRVNKYEKIYDGLLKRKENLIYVYDLEGNKKTIYYIPYDYKDIIFGEIENISFNNGKMLIQFNHAKKAGYFTAEYRHDINSIITINVDEDNNNTYYLYEDNKLIATSMSEDKRVTFYMQYNSEGIHKYQLKRKISKKKLKEELRVDLEEYKDIEKDLEVSVYYDPTINRLRTDTNSKELLYRNNRLYIEEELNKLEVNNN